MRSYISVGQLSETLLLLSAIKTYNCVNWDDIDHLTVCYGINKPLAYSFALQCEWIVSDSRSVFFTERGNEIIQEFNGLEISRPLWLNVLYDYVSICRPSWANMIPYGRRETYLFMTNDEKRCFIESGLMEGTEDVVVAWWDRLAQLFRGEHSDQLEDVGRIGERITLQYEKKRTHSIPIWESVDSNRSGYDIMSKKELDSDESILIEVKSSFKRIEEARMIITRNEWDVASCGYNINRYFFYLWLLGDSKRLAIIPAKEIIKHIPQEMGCGHWKTLEIGFELFRLDFIPYQPE